MERTLLFVKGFVTNYNTYVVLAIAFLLIGSGKRYINIYGIIKDYLTEFLRPNKCSGVTTLGTPLCLAVALNIKNPLDANSLEIITIIISILMSLFFSYLNYFKQYDEDEKSKKGNYNLKIQKSRYAKETKVIASYEVLISVMILILCFVFSICSKNVQMIISGIIYFLFFHMIINLCILLKRYNSSL